MVATRVLFATTFCLVSDVAVAASTMRERVTSSVSAEGAISNNIEMGLRMRQTKKRDGNVATSTALVDASQEQPKPSFSSIMQDIQTALTGVVEATTQFKEGQIQDGIITILNAAEALALKYIPADIGTQLATYTALIKESIENSQSIVSNLNKFKTDADTAALAAALIEIIDEIEVFVAQLEQDIEHIETGSIVKYFEALEEVIRGTSSSWSAFTAGADRDDIVSAIENIYVSVKSAVLKIIPEGDITEGLEIALTVFDSTIGNLTSIVQGFKQEMEMKVLCTPRSLARSGTTPTVCKAGFVNEGSRCIANVGEGADCWEACGKKPGLCDSYCGQHTNGQKTVCCREGLNDACECQEASGFRVTNTEHAANSYHQCVTAGPFVQASSLSQIASKKTNGTSMELTAARKHGPNCARQGVSALVDGAVRRKNDKPVPRGSTAAQCAPGTGELCDKKCVQACPANSIENGCKCRAECMGTHPHEQTVFGATLCGKDAMSISTYAMDALMAAGTLAALIEYSVKEESIKQLSETINAGIRLLQKLVIPQCEVPESLQPLLPGGGATPGGNATPEGGAAPNGGEAPPTP